MTQSIVIAVDGTAASGKGTLAKELARHFGFAHLDSGSLYRLTALGVIRSGGDPKIEADAVAAADRIDPAQSDSPTSDGRRSARRPRSSRLSRPCARACSNSNATSLPNRRAAPKVP